MKLVQGVGVNDADYATQRRKALGEVTVDGKCSRNLVWYCPFYRTWANMLNRCYSENYQKNKPTYIGCTVCKEWLTFSNFKGWMEKQPWEGGQLDKDIIFTNNKVYCPEACVFISQVINTFVTESTAVRGKCPIGVTWNKASKKFLARCGNPITRENEYLGCYDSPDEAHKAWLVRKQELAKLLAESQSDPRVAKALIERYENYKESVIMEGYDAGICRAVQTSDCVQ